MAIRIRDTLSNAVVLAVGVALAVGIAEAATRLFVPQKMSGSWYVIGPQGTYINKSSGLAAHAVGDRVVSYRFNSKHQRNDEEPNPGAARVLVLGDSFTFGTGLMVENTYVGLLQRDVDAKFGKGRIQLLNAGVGGGQGPLISLPILRPLAMSSGYPRSWCS